MCLNRGGKVWIRVVRKVWEGIYILRLGVLFLGEGGGLVVLVLMFNYIFYVVVYRVRLRLLFLFDDFGNVLLVFFDFDIIILEGGFIKVNRLFDLFFGLSFICRIFWKDFSVVREIFALLYIVFVFIYFNSKD